MDRVLALHAGSRGFDSHWGHMSERFFRSNRPGYPHPVSSELEISGIRVAVGDCSVTERRRWRPPYQTGKTVHVHANTDTFESRRASFEDDVTIHKQLPQRLRKVDHKEEKTCFATSQSQNHQVHRSPTC